MKKSLPKYPETIITSKKGVNFVREVVESAGCIFHKIDQDNDLGIDAIIELVRNNLPLSKQIGIQIKSGKTFFNEKKDQCFIPVENHFEYWKNYPLPVYGIIYVPSLKSANWINIKKYLNNYGPCCKIKFNRTKINIFNSANFMKYFICEVINELPEVSFNEALSLFNSKYRSEIYLGMILLFNIAPNKLEMWDIFIKFFKRNNYASIPPLLIYYFAHIPWHGDIAYHGEGFSQKIKLHVQKLFNKFEKQDVAKLLRFIDKENMIARGTIGQSVEAIISSIKNRDQLLLDNIHDRQQPMFIRECAAIIYAYHHRKDALPVLKSLSRQGSYYAEELWIFINENGWIDLYG